MPKTGVVKVPFPYAEDGVNIEKLTVGRVLSFPDQTFAGLKEAGYVDESKKEAENQATDLPRRDVLAEEIDRRLIGASDQELKDVIARSGYPVSGNLVHAHLVDLARAQIYREMAGTPPVLGIDPNSGVTEHPLAAPGAPTPPSASATVDSKEPANPGTGELGGAKNPDTDEAARKAADEAERKAAEEKKAGQADEERKAAAAKARKSR